MPRTIAIIAACIALIACEEAVNAPAPAPVDAGGFDAVADGSGLSGAGVLPRECWTSYDCDLDLACRDGLCVEVECVSDDECDEWETCGAPGLVGDSLDQFVCTQSTGCNYPWAMTCGDGRPYCNDPWTGEVSQDCPTDDPAFWR